MVIKIGIKAYQKEKAVFLDKNGLFEFWLPLVDTLRNQFTGPSKEVMGTIIVAQNQVKDMAFLPSGSDKYRDAEGLRLQASAAGASVGGRVLQSVFKDLSGMLSVSLKSMSLT